MNTFFIEPYLTQQWMPRRPEYTHSNDLNPKSSVNARSKILTATIINCQHFSHILAPSQQVLTSS